MSPTLPIRFRRHCLCCIQSSSTPEVSLVNSLKDYFFFGTRACSKIRWIHSETLNLFTQDFSLSCSVKFISGRESVVNFLPISLPTTIETQWQERSENPANGKRKFNCDKRFAINWLGVVFLVFAIAMCTSYLSLKLSIGSRTITEF